MLRSRRRIRAQAEIIGGVIVITALIISMGLVLTSLARLSSTSVTGISKRALFESEKSFETINVVYEDNTCYVQNAIGSSVKFVRIWSNSTPIDLLGNGFNLMLQPGEKRSLDELKSLLGVERIDHVVTSRGNVFPLESLCVERRQQQISYYYYYYYYEQTGTPFGSENILNSTKVSRGLESRYIYVNISSGSTVTPYPVVYNFTGKWYCSSQTDRGVISTLVIRDKNNNLIGSDADYTTINELIIINANNCNSITSPAFEWGYKNFDGTVTFVFKNLVNVTPNVDTIALYFKVLVLGAATGGVSQQLSTITSATIYNTTVSISTPVTATTAGARENLAVIFGQAIFPVKAFGLQLPTGVYDLRIELGLKAQSIDITGVRLEYIALVGADFAGPWIGD
ncbi:MAG: hypothetical protein QXV04_02710 [Desulfurococcaceae archaeon]